MKDYAKQLVEEYPIFEKISRQEEVLWVNDKYLPFNMIDGLCQLVVSDEDIRDAEERLARFAPFIKACFPETEATDGVIESPLQKIPEMQKALGEYRQSELGGKLNETTGSPTNAVLPGKLLLKMDSHLAVAGSIKARGGIYEVLKHAEELALKTGRLKITDDYSVLNSREWKEFFGQYTVQVGSTGNLGLSIGISSAAVGFRVKVHMSADAKQWKKDLLRSKGVEVVEYESDYSAAVAEGRQLSAQDPKSYFVDDENSKHLFLGYAVAASRLAKQLTEQHITVDGDHPLFVYLPAGVGGAPGGVAYGLKRIFKDNVHCFFAEPTHCPSVLLGMATERYGDVSVRDFDIDGITEADGLACARPSGFVTRMDRNIISGDFTVDDARLYDFMRMLHDTENIRIEPSSCAAFLGPLQITRTAEDAKPTESIETPAGRSYLDIQDITDEKLKNSTHICWATGGALVPEDVWEELFAIHL